MAVDLLAYMRRVVTLKLSPEALKRVAESPAPSKPGRKRKDRTAAQNATESLRPPRASLSAVNANLKALNKTAAPCRKWRRGALELRSFTGFEYQVGGWLGGVKEGGL